MITWGSGGIGVVVATASKVGVGMASGVCAQALTKIISGIRYMKYLVEIRCAMCISPFLNAEKRQYEGGFPQSLSRRTKGLLTTCGTRIFEIHLVINLWLSFDPFWVLHS